MATLNETRESFHTFSQTLSTKLAAVSSNSKFMATHHTELETLSNSIKEITLLLGDGENEKEMQSKSNIFGELSDMFCEVDNILRLFSRKRYHHKIENELKAINIKQAKSLKKLRLLNFYNPEHDIENTLKEEESFYKALHATNTKLALFSSNKDSKEPCCVDMEIKTLTDCIVEVVPLLHKCKKDTDKQSKHILFRELNFVFSNINKTLQLYQYKNCHENHIASELRLINTEASKSLEKFRLVNLYESKNDTAKMRIGETLIEEETGYIPNINKLVESVKEEGCIFTILQDLSTRLTSIISCKTKGAHSNITSEMKTLFTYVEEIKLFTKDGMEEPRKCDNFHACCDELSELLCEIDINLQFSSLKGEGSQIATDLKKSRIKLGKFLKKIRSASLNNMTDYDITKMKISNSPVRAVPVSGKNDDKDKIIHLLISYKETRLMEPCLVPIVVENGEKPTKFCQNIIEDNRVKNHFNRIIWINSDRLIDDEKIYRLVQRKQSTLFWVYKIIKDGTEECGLLVIDGIQKIKQDPFNRRCEERTDWWGTDDKMIVKIGAGKRDPWNIITSQNWSLEEAWKRVEEECNRDDLGFEFEKVGKAILRKVHKWETNEIMVKALSHLLSQNVEIEHWKMIMESAFWNLPFYDESLTASVLKKCYYKYEDMSRPDEHYSTWFWNVIVM